MEITDLLTDHRVPWHTEGDKTRDGWVNMRCPYCNKEPYLGYNLRGKYFHCWSCGHQSLVHTLMLLTGLDAGVCKQLVGDLPCENLPKTLKHTGRLQLPENIGRLHECHRAYLRKRHFSPLQLVNHWDIRGICQLGGNLRWRLFLPIYLRGEMVSWTTRAIGQKEPRYLAAEDSQSAVPVNNLLYGIDACRNSVIVVEGPTDAWRIGPGCVALMGQQVTPARLEQLSRFALRAICFDHEPQAEYRASKLANDLSPFPGRTVLVRLETGKDPDTASKDEIESLRREFLDGT